VSGIRHSSRDGHSRTGLLERGQHGRPRAQVGGLTVTRSVPARIVARPLRENPTAPRTRSAYPCATADPPATQDHPEPTGWLLAAGAAAAVVAAMAGSFALLLVITKRRQRRFPSERCHETGVIISRVGDR
jgi:hypothetical protein